MVLRTILRESTNEDKGRSCCPRNHCFPRRWMVVPTCRCCALGTFLDFHPPPDLWAFSAWVWLGCIQHLVGHTLRLEGKQSCKYNLKPNKNKEINQKAQTDKSVTEKDREYCNASFKVGCMSCEFNLLGWKKCEQLNWVILEVKKNAALQLHLQRAFLNRFPFTCLRTWCGCLLRCLRVSLQNSWFLWQGTSHVNNTTLSQIEFSHSGQCSHYKPQKQVVTQT